METLQSDKTIRAELIRHGDVEQIGLRFKYDPDIYRHLKKLDGIRWSQTHRCFCLAYSREDIRRLLNHCRGVVWVDMRGIPAPAAARPVLKKQPDHPVIADLAKQVSDLIILRGYSRHTLKSYVNHIKVYLGHIVQIRDPLTMTKADIEQYLLDRNNKKTYSESDTNMHINAIKFLYEQVLGKERMLFYLPRPEKPLQLPKVLGEHELERLFRAVPYLKHKTILLTAFSCGLRVGEVIRLRIKDIDSERMQVFIERSKGKKDRYVNLSALLLDVLRQYMRLHKPTPKNYLFEGKQEGMHYSARSAQVIFKRAVRAAGINKDVTFHSLRHSFATHLLEKGVDIKYIKELLGHFDIKTTERYLHVAREKLIYIRSPLDYLDPNI